ncbi:hypothetical protein CDD80_7046 [Ophiocordyceps camponoti-rufipedis]|uniref:DH domain-containing protein n=1 Tax=Ophiocordyceps camponoti-rufipedis TaxID=2004952 RepID=A0A2C5XT22_9HYPO|nr:hypothetical protein CDD80_7046 [Ophiocordyceps camponoti-rufipedis]
MSPDLGTGLLTGLDRHFSDESHAPDDFHLPDVEVGHLSSSSSLHVKVDNGRSASSPIDDKASTNRAPSGKPSVKDLKKRFDENGPDSPSVPRAPLRQGATPLMATRPPVRPTNGTPRLRAGSALDSTASGPRLQRQKSAAQPPVAASSQSFASRIARPRSLVNGKPISSSKSMTQLQHRTLSGSSPSPPAVTSRPMLFGEISPDHCGQSIAGFGIQHARPRKTSESNLPGPRRRFSGPDVDSPSPNGCHRPSDTSQPATSPAPPGVRSRFHARSRSDASAQLTCVGLSCKPLPRTPSAAFLGHSSSVSKLPVSVRLLSSPVDSASPSSTRSNSPSTLKCSLATVRISSISSSASHLGNYPPTRVRTPTLIASARKSSSNASVAPESHTRLQQDSITAAPKASLPLRSSRPRLPVSAAGSRRKEMQASMSHLAPSSLADGGASRNNSEPSSRRQISIGPIDFERRREHIRLAYSKSIRESEALEARQLAAEKRRQEVKTVAKSRPSSELVPSEPSDAPDVCHEPATRINQPKEPVQGPSAGPVTEATEERAQETVEQPAEQSAEESAGEPEVYSAQLSADAATQGLAEALGDSSARPPLAVRTSDEVVATSEPATAADSPTLGLPGSFPVFNSPLTDTDRPPSFVSATSDTTEFDVEPQTNPPLRAQSPLGIHITIAQPSSPQRSTSDPPQPAYNYTFDEESDGSEQVSQDTRTSQDTDGEAEARKVAYETPVANNLEGKLVSSEKGISTHQTLGAVVSILPAAEEETDDVERSATVPFPRLELHDELDASDCDSESEHGASGDCDARREEDAVTDDCTEEMNEDQDVSLGQINFDAKTPSERTSTCASSDTGVVDDGEERQPGPSTVTANAPGLTVPPSRPQHDRLSQQSTWTDFSMDGMDSPDTAAQSRPDSPSFGHVTIFQPRPRGRKSPTSFADVSHSSSVLGLDDSKRSATHVNQTRLTEIETGHGFFVPNLSSVASVSLSFLPSPDHEPPPIPASVSGSALDSRTSSVFYDQSHYGSTLVNSEREVDEYASPAQTPRSMDMPSTSTEDADGQPTADGGIKPEKDSKERHRLVQRRNVIKELVDTEAVFVRDMNIIEEIYKGTAEACPELDSKTVKLIFRNSDEIIHFHTQFLRELKEAVAPVYVPVAGRSLSTRGDAHAPERGHSEPQDGRDRTTSLGTVFQNNVENMRLAHEGFLRNSDQAAKRLIQIQQDPTVKVWLNECNEVAKDLTAAWDLDSLLIKPMQRITKYPNLIMTLLQHTPGDHPDREALLAAKESLETAIIEINRTKKNFELVGQIVGRKRKESDVKAGFARAFGKRVDKLQTSNNRPREDQEYVKLNERFGDDYLRLQVVLRDVEYYTRQVSAYVREFLQYLSSIELVMRFQPGNYPELESKWVQFNISVRDLEKVALEEHLAQVRKHVIEPFELVIKAYGNPSLAMKKRQKRRLDYERSEQLKRAGKTADPKLRELVEQYEALNDTLKKELPMLSALTEKVGNICLGNFVNIQANWYEIWREKMKTVLGDCGDAPDLKEVVSTFQRDHPYVRDQLASIGMLNPASRGRLSQSASSGLEDASVRTRGRVLSINADAAPILPTPDFGERRSGSLTMSPSGGASPRGTSFPTGTAASTPQQYYYRDYYSGIQVQQGAGRSPVPASTRPSTSRSIDSGGVRRPSLESSNAAQRDSSTTCNSSHAAGGAEGGRRFSNMFHSALPLPDGPEDSRRSSRASSRERSDGYRVLWLAASLFEFNISTTKHEAGYPYLTYQAGEVSVESRRKIFDVVAEKGELWLAKNQDDATNRVGWIWSKHFAKLADS